MEKLEEYLARRKKEDGINEFSLNNRAENTQICVNFIFEYFNQYLNINEVDQKMILNDERLAKFKNQVEIYEEDIQEWLTNIFDTHGKYIHRSIISFLKKDDLFFLYHTDSEFRSSSYNCYAELVKKNPFLKDQTEMLFNFIKNYHKVQSQREMDFENEFLTEEIAEWVEKTWSKYNVSIPAFISNYTERFSNNYSLWPVKHRIKTNIKELPYDYDYRQKSNLFNLNSFYTRISNKPFLKGKKQFLEILMMHTWLHSIDGDESYWDEYINKVIKNLDTV